MRQIKQRIQILCAALTAVSSAIGCSAIQSTGKAGVEDGVSGPVRLLARSLHQDYEKATFSLEFGVRDDPDSDRTSNDWDIQYGNGGNTFTVTMITDDRSRLVDLGAREWSELDMGALPTLPPHPAPTREPEVPAVSGHVYMVHTVDGNSDFYGLFRVEALDPGDWVDISWMQIEPDSWRVAGGGADA